MTFSVFLSKLFTSERAEKYFANFVRFLILSKENKNILPVHKQLLKKGVVERAKDVRIQPFSHFAALVSALSAFRTDTNFSLTPDHYCTNMIFRQRTRSPSIVWLL